MFAHRAEFVNRLSQFDPGVRQFTGAPPTIGASRRLRRQPAGASSDPTSAVSACRMRALGPDTLIAAHGWPVWSKSGDRVCRKTGSVTCAAQGASNGTPRTVGLKRRMRSLALRETEQRRGGRSKCPSTTAAARCHRLFRRAVASERRPLLYRVGTLAESGRRSAIQPTAAQGPPAAMLDPFSLGSARKGVSRAAPEQENRAVARFLKPSAGLEPATPSLPWRFGAR
jgi:hypothetical protein